MIAIFNANLNHWLDLLLAIGRRYPSVRGRDRYEVSGQIERGGCIWSGLFTTAAWVCDEPFIVAIGNDNLTAGWPNAVGVAAIGSIHDPFPTSCTRVPWDFPSFPVSARFWLTSGMAAKPDESGSEYEAPVLSRLPSLNYFLAAPRPAGRSATKPF